MVLFSETIKKAENEKSRLRKFSTYNIIIYNLLEFFRKKCIFACGVWYAFENNLMEMLMETTKELYEAPQCTVVEMDVMQVICTSGTGVHQGFTEDETSYGW